MNRTIKITSFLLFGISQFAFSQIKEEKLILERKREPEVKKIEKKKTSVTTIKNYPPKEKKIADSLNLKYDITDVPAVSDFKTSNIQAADISPKFEKEVYNNYVRFGMGNYGKILGDANISTTLENKLEVGADVHYLSTSGLKKLYAWDSNATNAQVGGFLNHYGEKGKFNLIAEYNLNVFNYYGIYALNPDANIDLQQKTNQIKINGVYDHYSNEILNDLRLKTSFLSDRFGAKENYGSVSVNLSKHSVPMYEEVTLNGDLGIGLETLTSDFSLLNQNSSHYLNATLSPKVTLNKGNSHLILGIDLAFLNGKYHNNTLANEQKNNKIYWFPKAEFLFATKPEIQFFAGVEGGLQLNSYADLLEKNPYLVSDQMLLPTETQYHFYVGLKGDIDENLKYNISTGFGKINHILYFQANGLYDYNVTLNRSAYNFANTFSAVYENGNVVDLHGSVQYFPLENLLLDAEFNLAKYNLTSKQDILNTPLVTGSLGAKYALINKKLLLGFKGIFSSEKTTNSFAYSTTGINPNIYVPTEFSNEKIGGFVDINLSAEYKIHKNFSIFALGNNLLNSNYQTNKGYKVLGTQFLGGVKISF